MKPYFASIRHLLHNGNCSPNSSSRVGTVLRDISPFSSDERIWKTLMASLKVDGIDFENLYSQESDNWKYGFNETIILSHTILLLAALQKYGPLSTKMDASKVKEFPVPEPILVVAMVGDCVKPTCFFENLSEQERREMKSTRRYTQKLKVLFSEMISEAMAHLPRKISLHIDSLLIGSGAFGGNVEDLSAAFLAAVSGLAFKDTDIINLWAFPPPAAGQSMFQGVTRAKCSLNPLAKGLANRIFNQGDILRVLIIGSDPISIMPHVALGRGVSGEAQCMRATDSMTRLTGKPGNWTLVSVPSLPALNAKTGQTEVQSGYVSICYLPAFTSLMPITTATPITTPISGNGDCLNGWTFASERGTVPTWKDVEMPPPIVILSRTPGQESVLQDIECLDVSRSRGNLHTGGHCARAHFSYRMMSERPINSNSLSTLNRMLGVADMAYFREADGHDNNPHRRSYLAPSVSLTGTNIEDAASTLIDSDEETPEAPDVAATLIDENESQDTEPKRRKLRC